jgi:hypothetical protein
MKNKMMLLKLTLVGKSKDYTVNFRKGLNYISGHMSTGKSSILEMIDYALGSKQHKSYIEISNNCTDVVLELFINEDQYLIRRKLFDFEAAVIVEIWDNDEGKYIYYTRCAVGSPNNKNSLSAFLMERINLSDITISKDTFSFRDLFKYSYLKQTEIDSEDILNEKQWALNNKRKATFEIIFNIYDNQLDNYKKARDKAELDLKELEISVEGISEFLSRADITNMEDFLKNSKDLSNDINILRNKLISIKTKQKITTPHANELRERIISLKTELLELGCKKREQIEYISKLRLLQNQYDSEVEKRQMAKQGYFSFSQYDFLYCPNCFAPLNADERTHDICCLCGNENTERSNEELFILDTEIKQIKRKNNELGKFIDNEETKLDTLIHRERQCFNELTESEQELQSICSDYDNPYIEDIEAINYEIGQKTRLQYETEQKIKMIEDLKGLHLRVANKQNSIKSISDAIRELSKITPDKQKLITDLSKYLYDTLKAFEYPKLTVSRIDEKDYLPYVRDHKYDDIGSLAGVSLITMAYYLTILHEGMKENYHHLNLLMIDSPRKNFGAKSISDSDDEFKDEKIFEGIIKHFIDIDKNYSNELQIIVVNNGYPDFLPPEYIIAEFDTENDELPNGLIDDVI